MTASVQMTGSASVSSAGPRAMLSTSDRSAGLPDSRETSSLDDLDESSQDAPSEDDAPAGHSTFGAVLHQIFRPSSNGSSGRSGQSNRSGQQKGNASDPSLLVAPVQTNEKFREMAPFTLAIPWSKNEVNRSEDTGVSTSSEAAGQSSRTTPEIPDSPGAAPSSSKSGTPGNPLQAAQPDQLAFAARLSPPGAIMALDNPVADAAGMSSVRGQSSPKQTLAPEVAASFTQAPSQMGASDAPVEQLVKINATPLPAQLPNQTANQAASQSDPAASIKSEVRPAFAPSAARVEQVAEPPAPQPSSSRDIMVRIPDTTDRGTNVRFVERGSEVHISVHTGDPELAQTLRGGLSELTGRLQQNGIQAEVWRPGSDASQSDSQNQSPDSKGSSDRRNQSGAQRDGQDQPSENKPRWVQELEASINEPVAHSGS